MRKIYPLGHKSSIRLLSSKGKIISSKEAKIIIFAVDKGNIVLKHGIHLAFAASKKIFSKAVDRNLIKRRFRGALQELIKNFDNTNTTILMLIIPRNGATAANFETLKKLISKSLKISDA